MLKTRKEIKDYLDSCIRYWRRERDKCELGTDTRAQAVCYVDAYQSVRMSIFDELLPKEE